MLQENSKTDSKNHLYVATGNYDTPVDYENSIVSK